MPNVYNYAEQYQRELIDVIIGGAYTANFITDNVKWIDAKSFHFTTLRTSGFKNHVRDGVWNKGNITQNDVPYTVMHDRDIEFFIDKADVMETNKTATVQNISNNFIMTNQTPEVDAVFFSKVSKVAIDSNNSSSTNITDYTTTTVVAKLKELFRKNGLSRYKARGALVAFVRPEIMDALELAKDFVRNIDVSTVSDKEKGIETRVTYLDGVNIIEVIDIERFYTEFDYTEGFTPTVIAKKINVLLCSPLTAVTVPKISSIYFFEPGEHSRSDGYLYQNRSMWDTFVFPNALNDKYDSVYADIEI